ncbi:cell wall-binding repeat-containing protein [Herbiconiux flava]|uniref:Putative cell wall-binding protein n=1 Tax=Herbiconiux flava TaxID=881268 RepID=A0A852ST90_9MICO|nr:cell wall-binding repeat-containing protein [Herbiconiux flava]NYD72011.1 putative cell wall-binding protein [Herbiconiux flava]GLK18026.1 hypothetical protein GCM10017602_25080 [Herbiconiux flava]
MLITPKHQLMKAVAVSLVLVAVAIVVPTMATPAQAAAPIPVDDAYSVLAQGVLSVGAEKGVLANDVDVPANSEIALLLHVANGGMNANVYGAFTYRPEESFVGTDSFTYCLASPTTHLCEIAAATVTITVESSVERIGGADRFATAADLSASEFTSQIDTVYVASGVTYPDALSASSAAGGRSGPILLVTGSTIPSETDAALRRLNAQRIVIVGGERAVSASVETALRGYGAAEVTRMGGSDRFAVSAEVSRRTFAPYRSVVYVASGENFPDALSATATTDALESPVLLTRRTGLPEPVKEALTRLEPNAIVVIGGEAAIAPSVVDELKKLAPAVSRVIGADRYAVSAALMLDSFEPADVDTVYVAAGDNFPDALAAAPVAGHNRAPVLLVARESIPAVIADALDAFNPNRIVVVGGSSVISPAVEAALAAHLR